MDALDQEAQPGTSSPLFFLIDEIFRGTNNRERQIGSHAYTTALAGKNGVGLISTHDLELAHLSDSIPAVRNLHFREDILDDRMVFDFKIRPGASPTTNALRIMALAGLPIEEGVKKA
jgi:DNA mismatch repair ATPase MutS